MDLTSVSKLKAIGFKISFEAIGFKISFGDEEGRVVIRRPTTNEFCCVEVEINEIF